MPCMAINLSSCMGTFGKPLRQVMNNASGYNYNNEMNNTTKIPEMIARKLDL